MDHVISQISVPNSLLCISEVAIILPLTIGDRYTILTTIGHGTTIDHTINWYQYNQWIMKHSNHTFMAGNPRSRFYQCPHHIGRSNLTVESWSPAWLKKFLLLVVSVCLGISTSCVVVGEVVMQICSGIAFTSAAVSIQNFTSSLLNWRTMFQQSSLWSAIASMKTFVSYFCMLGTLVAEQHTF